MIFVGPSSIGKSTLAGGFHKRGYPLLSDDVCAVTAKNGADPHIIPGFPSLKLWADALKKLGEDKKGFNRVRLDQDFEKYFVPFQNTGNSPVSVRSVFVLDTTNTDKFEIVPLRGGDKIDPIINNTYRPRFLEGLGGKKEHFKQCAAVAARADVIRISRQRKESGFKEKSPSSEIFFRKGEVGSWREELTKKQARQIVNDHRKVMRRFGYPGSDHEIVS